MDTHADRTRPFAMTWALFWILVGMGILAVALGFVGFRLDFPEDSVELSIYKSVQLLTLESGDSGKPASWPLAVARWLAPISLLGGAIQFLRSLYHRMRLQHRAGFSSDHVLVMGLGHTGTAFVRAHLGARTGCRVLGIEIDPGIAVQELARDPRFLLVPGDARDPAVRKAASMARAQEIVIATDVDERNLELAEACKQELEKAGRKGCTIRVHLTDVALRDALQRSASAPGGGHGLFGGNKDVRVLLVNHFVDQARKLVFLNPLEMVCGRNGATNPNASIHLVLTGVDRLQTAVLLEVARVGHYSHGRKVNVHLVCEAAAGALDRIRASYPKLERCLASLSVFECPHGAGYVWHVANVIQRLPAEALVTVLPSTLGGEELHADVFRLREQVPGRAVQVLLPRSGHRAGESGWVRQLHGAQGGIVLGGCVREFEVDAILAECVVDAADGKDDRLGEKIHNNWLTKEKKKIANLLKESEQAKASGDADLAAELLDEASTLQRKATHREWKDFTEAQREDNHAQASHFAIKVRAAGFDSTTLTEASWSAIDVECLARMEHERWMAMKWYAGWEHDVTRDDAARRHPDLVPYDQLSEDVKKHDRNAVHNVIEFLPDLVDELRKTERR